MMGYLKDATGSFTAGLILLGLAALAGAIATMTMRVNPQLEQAGPADAMLAH